MCARLWLTKRGHDINHLAMRLPMFASMVGICAALACTTPPTAGCNGYKLPPDQRSRISITQGIAGEVLEWVGDFGTMPSCGTVTPLTRTLLVYPPTAVASLPPNDGSPLSLSFVESLPGTPIDSVRSDTSGFFELALPPGSYTVVVRHRGLLYIAAGTNNILYVSQHTVQPGHVEFTLANITDRAAF